ncbi:hypothetical protein [Ornithinibacillus caprae]|uniref:hypothetical protein n=1 Tax=Ornithinibacillus caprae TaxID=2678566 RepID=UPI0012D8F5E7
MGHVKTDGYDVFYKKIPYQTRNMKAFMTNKREGFLKLLWDKHGVIIGVLCIGHQAKDIIAIIALMIKLKVTIHQAVYFCLCASICIRTSFYCLTEVYKVISLYCIPLNDFFK